MQQDTLNSRSESGFMLMDVLVAIILASIVALGVMQSTLVSYRFSHMSKANGVARELAVERLESLATVDPETFADGDQQTESGITRSGITFDRVTDFSIAPDRSREVRVTVTATRTQLPVEVQLEQAFALWGER